MFLKENVKKVRSLFNGFAIAGVAAAALLMGANAATANAQVKGDRTDAPSGGAANKFLDFTGNGRTDFVTVALAAPNSGGPISWRVAGNPASAVPNQAFIRRFDYGTVGTTADNGDAIVVGDYTGDNKAELAVFRGADQTALDRTGIWYLAQFPTGPGPITIDRAVRWGDGFSDAAVTGDYDGDGKADYAVFRLQTDPQVGGQAVSGYWYILSSGTNTTRAIKFGQYRDASGAQVTGAAVFNGADFNGDGRDELIYITRNSAGTVVNYFIGDALTGAGVITRSYGNYNADYSITPADYTGDGKADFVVCRQTDTSGIAIWYIMNSATGAVTATRFGIADPLFMDGDIPVRGDYDGDNRHDIAVWRPSNRTFYWISSINGSFQAQQFGETTDTPLGAFGEY